MSGHQHYIGTLNSYNLHLGTHGSVFVDQQRGRYSLINQYLCI